MALLRWHDGMPRSWADATELVGQWDKGNHSISDSPACLISRPQDSNGIAFWSATLAAENIWHEGDP